MNFIRNINNAIYYIIFSVLLLLLAIVGLTIASMSATTHYVMFVLLLLLFIMLLLIKSKSRIWYLATIIPLFLLMILETIFDSYINLGNIKLSYIANHLFDYLFCISLILMVAKRKLWSLYLYGSSLILYIADYVCTNFDNISMIHIGDIFHFYLFCGLLTLLIVKPVTLSFGIYFSVMILKIIAMLCVYNNIARCIIEPMIGYMLYLSMIFSLYKPKNLTTPRKFFVFIWFIVVLVMIILPAQKWYCDDL